MAMNNEQFEQLYAVLARIADALDRQADLTEEQIDSQKQTIEYMKREDTERDKYVKERDARAEEHAVKAAASRDAYDRYLGLDTRPADVVQLVPKESPSLDARQKNPAQTPAAGHSAASPVSRSV
jgi:hypothetical protein